MCSQHGKKECPELHERVDIDEDTYIPQWQIVKVERNYG